MAKLGIEDLKMLTQALLKVVNDSQIKIKDILIGCHNVKTRSDLADLHDEITDAIAEMHSKWNKTKQGNPPKETGT